MTAGRFQDVLAARNRDLAAAPAPAQGLTLAAVQYLAEGCEELEA